MKSTPKSSKVILIFLIILFFCLLCLMIVLQFFLKNNKENTLEVSTTKDTKQQTVKSVIEKYESEYINQENNSVYVKLSKDLYESNGKSNKDFFYNLTNELEIFFEYQDFFVIDNERKIEIYAKFDEETEKYIITINGLEDFYNQTNGDAYIAVENSEIVKPSKIFIENGFLERLVIQNMYMSSIEKFLTDEKKLDNGYMSYNEGKLNIKIAPNDSVMNIVFTENYNGSILNDVDRGETLEQVYEKHPDNTFGSLSDGFLGYRNGDLYYFFYKDEASIYGYSYAENELFEELLKQYLEDKDLEKFVTTLSSKMLSYDTFEYDADIKKATMIFPTRGIEIKIRDNDSKGITLYSNYYFTEKTKDFVKKGLISYSTEDLVARYESQRRESK